MANYPVSVITDGMGLNITVMSYCGRMDFGIVSDRDQMPDVQCLIDWISDELEELKPKRRGRRSRSSNGARGRRRARLRLGPTAGARQRATPSLTCFAGQAEAA